MPETASSQAKKFIIHTDEETYIGNASVGAAIFKTTKEVSDALLFSSVEQANIFVASFMVGKMDDIEADRFSEDGFIGEYDLTFNKACDLDPAVWKGEAYNPDEEKDG